MITIRIEFYSEVDRLDVINNLKLNYRIIEEGEVKPTKRKNSKAQIQYIEIIRKR